MKTKRLFAAAICAAALLSGCGKHEVSDNSSYGSLNSTESSSSESTSSSISSVSDNSSSISSSSSEPASSSSPAEKKVYSRIYPETSADTNSLGEWVFNFQLSDKGGEDFFDGNGVKQSGTTVYVYASDSPDSVGTVVQKKVIPEDAFGSYEFFFDITPWETTKYIRIKVVGKDFTSEYSNYYEIPPKKVSKPEIPRYTHTFTVPNYLEITPDYSSAEKAIKRGEKPDGFNIQVKYTCPGCGTRSSYNILWKLPYSSDGELPFNHTCGTTNCPYRRTKVSTSIKSHAVRVS